MAGGSALECGAVQDVLQVCGALTAEENEKTKALLDRIVAMLTKLGQRGYAVHEAAAEYGTGEIDPDPDPDRKRRGPRQHPQPLNPLVSLSRPIPFVSPAETMRFRSRSSSTAPVATSGAPSASFRPQKGRSGAGTAPGAAGSVPPARSEGQTPS